MQVTLEPEIVNASLSDSVLTHTELKEAALAMLKSVDFLETFGSPDQTTEQDKDTARDVMLNNQPITAVQNSATAHHLRALLSEYDVQVAKTAAQLRTFVTNRLIEESAPESKHRMRALELLGKISEVGLFTERSEVTIKHQTTVELEQKVREKISTLISKKTAAQDITPRETSPEVLHNRVSELTDMLVKPPNDASDD